MSPAVYNTLSVSFSFTNYIHNAATTSFNHNPFATTHYNNLNYHHLFPHLTIQLSLQNPLINTYRIKHFLTCHHLLHLPNIHFKKSHNRKINLHYFQIHNVLCLINVHTIPPNSSRSGPCHVIFQVSLAECLQNFNIRTSVFSFCELCLQFGTKSDIF